MYIKTFLTKYEYKNHKKVFANKKFKKDNLPLYVSMQIIYGDSLRQFANNAKIQQTAIEKELLINDALVEKLKAIYNVDSKDKLIFENNEKTDLYVDKKIHQNILRAIKWYKRHSKIHEIFKKNKIDLVYVY
ncbi:hypothetical protein [Spiroplasma endosymbiont of Aspidapion aeneum]|uniref:hypothetical protein n=1 Tax=Spiroplasma endosymbiont of Aspidapion aeneum TaxID=3066276 RepID=UPI00313BE7B4